MRRSREDMGLRRNGWRGAFDAFGGDFGGHAEFFEAQGAVAAAIDVNFFVEGGLEAESAESEMLDGFEDFGVSFEEDFLVAAVEVGDDFGVAFQAGVSGRDGADVYFELEAGGADAVVEKFLQRFRGGGAIEFAVANEVGDHRLVRTNRCACFRSFPFRGLSGRPLLNGIIRIFYHEQVLL